jgi:hypothetical protein
MTINPNAWYSANEAAAILGVSVRYLCYDRDGLVQTHKIQCTPKSPQSKYRKYRFRGEWIEAYINPVQRASNRGRKPRPKYQNLEL